MGDAGIQRAALGDREFVAGFSEGLRRDVRVPGAGVPTLEGSRVRLAALCGSDTVLNGVRDRRNGVTARPGFSDGRGW